MRVALDIDLGERGDEPEELYELATIVNVACGGHAGDDASMARAVGLARQFGARLSAHPSYPDRARFGRVAVDMLPAELAREVRAQCAALAAVAAASGGRVELVKPHGALYHDTRDPAVAEALLSGALSALGDVLVIGPPSGPLREQALGRGAGYLREGFADRGYRDGDLLPRGERGALLVDPAECAAQATRLAESGELDALCVHGDGEGAVAIARAVRDALAARGLLDGAR